MTTPRTSHRSKIR